MPAQVVCTNKCNPKSRVTATWRKLTNHWTYINPP
jgi:hypothetical protein